MVLKAGKPLVTYLGPPVVPFLPYSGEGSPTKIDYPKKGTLVITSLLEDLATIQGNGITGHVRARHRLAKILQFDRLQ